MKNKKTIERVRKFNRFYAHFFGLYNNKFLESKFSLSEARVIFELGICSNTSKDLIDRLELDPGYLSRIIKKFEKNKYIEKVPCDKDGRRQYIHLTEKGKEIRSKLDTITNFQIGSILEGLSEEEDRLLCEKMDDIEDLLKNKNQ